MEAERTLKRLLANGPLTAMPKRPEDQALIARLAGTRFAVGRGYSEAEVNETLKSWIATFSAEYGVDHVTLRRYMVDSRILGRDKAGVTYRVDPASLVDVDAAIEPGRLLAQAVAQREERKKKHAG